MKSTIHDHGDRVSITAGRRQVVFGKKHWRVAAEMIAMLLEEIEQLHHDIWKLKGKEGEYGEH